MREALIEAYCVAQVKLLGGEVRKVKWIGRKHAPDRLVMLPLRPCKGGPSGILLTADTTIWAEFKATGVLPEEGQLREHARMRKMGQRVEVVDSFERVDEILR